MKERLLRMVLRGNPTSTVIATNEPKITCSSTLPLRTFQVVGKSFDNECNAAIAEIKTRGQEIIYPSEAELAKWADACKVQTNEWLAMTKSKGLPGQAILDEVIALAKKYKK